MIDALAFGGYRSLRDLVLELSQLTVITGPNGSGKSNIYRAMRLLASAASGRLVREIALEGGLPSALWAGPAAISRRMRSGEVQVEPSNPSAAKKRLRLGFAGDGLGYVVELGVPWSAKKESTDPDTGVIQVRRSTAFVADPEVRGEFIFTGPVAKRGALLISREGATARILDGDSGWRALAQLSVSQTLLDELGDPTERPEVRAIRDRLRSWRFHDSFRTDRDAPARRREVGTRTLVLDHDGGDLAAALQTILEVGDHEALAETIEDAFGARIEIDFTTPRFGVLLHQPGLLRPLDATELSDGTLRYLLLTAALLSPRPPEMLVLNEPEASLHPSLLVPLARLVARAARRAQVLVVSHAPKFVDALVETAAASVVELTRDLGETAVVGRGRLEGPPWHWPTG